MPAPREAILDLCTAVNAAESLEEILKTVIGRIADLMPHDRAGVALLEPGSATLEIRELAVPEAGGGAAGERGKRMPVDETTALGWVVVHGRPHLRRSLSEPYPFAAVQVTRPAASHILAPLVARHDVLGVLTIGSYREGAFDENDLEVFCRYARLTAVAIGARPRRGRDLRRAGHRPPVPPGTAGRGGLPHPARERRQPARPRPGRAFHRRPLAGAAGGAGSSS